MSSYLQYLPAVLQQGDFVGKFLLAFEAVLSGGVNLSNANIPAGEKELLGLDQLLDRVDTFFDPDETPEDFLPWLAQWVATSLRDDWTVETRRSFISQIVPLYGMRGTRAGIQAVLELSGEVATVVDFGDALNEATARAAFGFESLVLPPHLFGVILTVNQRDPAELERRERRVRAIVDREKPAHTVYALRINYPAMRIVNDPQADKPLGPGIIVGENTVLGTINAFATPQSPRGAGGNDD